MGAIGLTFIPQCQGITFRSWKAGGELGQQRSGPLSTLEKLPRPGPAGRTGSSVMWPPTAALTAVSAVHRLGSSLPCGDRNGLQYETADKNFRDVGPHRRLDHRLGAAQARVRLALQIRKNHVLEEKKSSSGT